MKQDENLRLIKELQNGNDEALTLLLNENMGLVKSLAMRFKDRGTETDDLIQLGSIGLIKAARSFDFSYNTVFSTYAVPLIIGEIRRFLRDDGQIKVSRSTKQRGIALLRAKEKFEHENCREPSISEIADMLDIPIEEATFCLEAVSPVKSLTSPTSDTDSCLTLEQVVADKDNQIDRLTDNIALRETIQGLDEMSKKIIHLRYVKEMSQQQVGEALGVSQVKISRKEKKIMSLLRNAL